MRAIVSDMAGTTRDSIDAVMERPAPPGSDELSTIYRFVDTAGIRRKGKVQFGPEFFMVNRALRAIRRADIGKKRLACLLFAPLGCHVFFVPNSTFGPLYYIGIAVSATHVGCHSWGDRTGSSASTENR